MQSVGHVDYSRFVHECSSCRVHVGTDVITAYWATMRWSPSADGHGRGYGLGMGVL